MSVRLADRISQLTTPAVAQFTARARELEARGRSLIYLVRGEPDFDTPAHICQAASQALEAGQTHYPPPQGIPELRQAVADRMQRDFSLELDPDQEVLVTSGATMGFFIAVQAILNPGDEVLLFDPSYDPYSTAVRTAGGVPVRVPTEAREGHFFVSPAAVEGSLTERTRAVVINSPWNPTGSVLRPDELADLVSIAAERDLVLIADEIYEKLVFDDHVHTCLAALSSQARARTVIVNSLSKTYAMTGWRLGYNLAPPPLIQAMLRVAQQFSRSATTFVQHAGVAALNGPQEPTNRMMQAYARRREFVRQSLARVEGPDFSPPEGTFFAFLNVRDLGDDRALADWLLEETGLVLIPGSVYGPSGEGFLRLSFAYSDETLQQGMEALLYGLNEFSRRG